MKVIKKIGNWFLIILIGLNIAILFSGKIYIYKALWNTYLKGRVGPSINEYNIFNNREVKAGVEQKWYLSKRYNTNTIPDQVQKHFSDLKTIAFVVIQNDSILHEQYWDGYGEDSKTNSFSMAKTFLSMMVGAAIDEGKIKSVDQPVGDFLPEFKEGKKAKITIKHLLTMSSGIDFDENYISPLAYPARAYYGNNLTKLTYGYDAAEEPGKVFKYLSGNSELVAFILKKATGKSISDYMSEKIWKPIGAKNTALWSLDHTDGVEKAYCCFNSDARDFARLGKLYLDTGKWNGNQIINPEYVLNSIKPADLLCDDGSKNDQYGYAWWLIPSYKGHYIFYARGILGQYIVCIPDKKMVVVRLGSKRERSVDNQPPSDLSYYLDAALEMYGK